ncbi:Proteoglycan 4 C-terminal part like [Melia azedarach]|uniref:Proteoglycan 4 C-terminal part like n=1 Tax=Melia azedarach TaxID=155640 RepID=A0ACC1X557_MELAZ|nr:Proteoglycan 4 C-terminal part like [Melia azedarach]
MAKVSSSMTVTMMVFVFAMAAAVVSAQSTEMAPAPAPSMDTGAAFSLPVSGAVIGSALIVSFVALLKH